MDEIQTLRQKAEEARVAAKTAAIIAAAKTQEAITAMRIAVEKYEPATFGAAQKAEKAAQTALRESFRLQNAADEAANEVSEAEISAFERHAESGWLRAAEMPLDLDEW